MSTKKYFFHILEESISKSKINCSKSPFCLQLSYYVEKFQKHPDNQAQLAGRHSSGFAGTFGLA